MTNVKKWKCPKCKQNELEENIDNDLGFLCIKCNHTEPGFHVDCLHCNDTNFVPQSQKEITCQNCSETFKNQSYQKKPFSLLGCFIGSFLLVWLCVFSFLGFNFIKAFFFPNQELIQQIEAIPYHEVVEIRSYARVIRYSEGFELNIFTEHQSGDYFTYQDLWQLKLVLDENATLTSQYRESGDSDEMFDGSDVGMLTSVKTDQPGVFLFTPTFPTHLLRPNDFEHNFFFKGITVEPGMNMQLYLVVFQNGTSYEVPIVILNP